LKSVASLAFNLAVNQQAIFYVLFHAGKKVQVTVTSKGESDVDLFVLDERPTW
jgi:hypothetical protein